eukprot:tig00020539_g10408.t1
MQAEPSAVEPCTKRTCVLQDLPGLAPAVRDGGLFTLPAWRSASSAEPPPGAAALESARGDRTLYYDADRRAAVVRVPLCHQPFDCRRDMAVAELPMEADPARDRAALAKFFSLGRALALLSTCTWNLASTSRPEPDRLCAVCLERPARPVEFTPCKHVLCLACALQLVAQPRALACPSCRVPPTTVRLLEDEHLARLAEEPGEYAARLAEASAWLPKCLPAPFTDLYADPRWMLGRAALRFVSATIGGPQR